MTAYRAVTDEELGQFARKTRELQSRLEKGVVPFVATMDGLQTLIEDRAVEIPMATTEFVQSVDILSAPADLFDILESQIDRLIEVGGFKQVGLSTGKYRDELIAVTKAFVWRPELAAIGLTEVALVDYRLSGRFLVEAGEVYCYIDPDRCQNFQGVVTPNGVLVIQAQWGEKYREKKPRWCRDNFHALEQGGIVKEGLTAYLHGGKELLKKCYMDLPGSVSEDGNVPYLYWDDGRPRLSVGFDGYAYPSYGSVSRGS